MCEGHSSFELAITIGVMLLLALAGGCRDETAPGSDGGGGDDSGECVHGDTDDPGGGCPDGYYCAADETCQQDCVDDETCVELHGFSWVCNEHGQCEMEGGLS